jgi:hypothetical protein
MSFYPPNCDCSGVLPTITQCPFPTPGILSNPRAVAAFDYRNQPGQVASPSVPSFLIASIDGNGNPVITWTNSPNVLPASYPLTLGQTFTGLLSAMGSAGQFRVMTPTGLTGTAYLTANAAGQFVLSPAPTSLVPDPLTIGTIDATNLNSNTLTIAGLITLTGIAAGTVTQFIGLNASNQIVTGAGAPSGCAQYYENTSLVSTATPNSSISLGTGTVIGNEIYDPNGIAHVGNSQTVVMDKAGQFKVSWGGTWGATSGLRQPALSLAYNGTGNIVSNGYSSKGVTNNNSGFLSFGEWAQTLSIGDTLSVMPTGTFNTTSSGLTNVGLMIQQVA